ncbi:MAG: AI-2E family transporter [Proteobacteria bacterium]|nr:AI-2E family transporter [Pseudomonadota bacterium]
MQNDLSYFLKNNKTFKLWFVLSCIFLFLLYVFYQINAIIAPFIMGFLGAYLFHVPMKKMEALGIFRSLSAFVIVSFMYVLFILFAMWAIPFVQKEIILLIKSYPELQKKFFNIIDPYLKSFSTLGGAISPDDIKKQFIDWFGSIFNFSLNLILSLFTNGLAIANILAMLILTPIVMFYSLKDWDKLLKHINSLIPPTYAPLIKKQISDINTKLGQYAKGQLLVCSILIVAYSIFLFAINLPYAFLIGFLTGFLAFIPYFGVAIGFLLSMTVGFTHFPEIADLLKIVIVFGILSSFEGYFLTPRLIGQSIGLHPVLIIFALFALGSWFGLLGIVLAFPLSAIITTIVRNFIGWYKNKFITE